MSKRSHIARNIIRFENGRVQHVADDVVTEVPLTIYLDEQEFATLVCTPEQYEELVIGFLASEGVIRSYADIKSLLIDTAQGFAHVETHQVQKLHQSFYSKRYITSCCGKSRQSFYFYNDAKTAKRLTAHTCTLSFADCFRLMEQLQATATTFQSTGGVHYAALGDRSGLLLSRMDIGRHNALDKIYGHCLQQNMPLQDKAIVFSGRVSSEVLLKAAKIGCAIVLSKSAPTELALDIAEELGLTVVGFIRNGTLNVYTHPERIVLEP